MPDVPANIAKLSAECAADLLRTVFFAFGKSKVIFPGTSPVTPWQRQAIGFTETVNDGFQFLPCFVQEGDILRVTDISGAHVASSVKIPLCPSRINL